MRIIILFDNSADKKDVCTLKKKKKKHLRSWTSTFSTSSLHLKVENFSFLDRNFYFVGRNIRYNHKLFFFFTIEKKGNKSLDFTEV